MSLRLLLDANMSPRTATFLRERFGFDASSLIERGQGTLKDSDVARSAIEEQRILLTFDLDFGEIFHHRTYPELSVIIFRLVDESSPAVNRFLERFFDKHSDPAAFKSALTVVNETRLRRRSH